MNQKIVLIILVSLALIFGVYMFLGALRNWNHFNKGYKRIDLISLFGVYGRLLYVIIGLIIIVISSLIILAINHIGPLAKYLNFNV